MSAIPWRLIAEGALIALILGFVFHLGYKHGDAAGVRLVRAADAKVLATTVDALQAQFKAEATDRARVESAFDQWRIDHAKALVPVAAPDVRLCIYTPVAGDHRGPEAGANPGSSGGAAVAAGGRGPGVRPGDSPVRVGEGPNIGPLFVALGALLDDTSAFARACRAAGR